MQKVNKSLSSHLKHLLKQEFKGHILEHGMVMWHDGDCCGIFSQYWADLGLRKHTFHNICLDFQYFASLVSQELHLKKQTKKRVPFRCSEFYFIYFFYRELRFKSLISHMQTIATTKNRDCITPTPLAVYSKVKLSSEQ